MAFACRAQVPNLLLHGPTGCGKSSALKSFLHALYGDKRSSTDLVLTLDCARDRGTSFVRGDLKHFARSQLCPEAGRPCFRSVVVRNADLLTHDAQSALRRSIEVYSHTARFFLLAQDTSRLLRPVLSRFCMIYFPRGVPVERGEADRGARRAALARMLRTALTPGTQVLDLASAIYNKGFAVTDVVDACAVRALPPGTRLAIDKASRLLSDDRALIAYVLSHMKRAVR